MEDLSASRPTASKYLQALVRDGFLIERKIERSKFFIHTQLFDLLRGIERNGEEGDQ